MINENNSGINLANHRPLSSSAPEKKGVFENRIRFLFLGVFITITLYACTATSVFISLYRTRNDLIEKYIKKLIFLKDFEVSVRGSVGSSRGFILTNDASFQMRINDRRAESAVILSKLKDGSENAFELELISEVENALRDHNNRIDEIFLLRDSGETPLQLKNYFEDELRPKREVLDQALGAYQQLADQKFERADLRAKKLWHVSFVLFGSVALLSLLLLGTIRWVLTRALKEKKETEEALTLSEMISRQAVDLTEMGIFDHDHIHETIYWSPQMRLIFGISAHANMTLYQYIELIPAEERENVLSAIQRAHDPAGSGAYEVDHRIVHVDGTIRWVTVKSQTFFDLIDGIRKPVRTIGSILDITKRKETEISIRKALDDLAWEKRKLERSNSELEQFASIAAHDLRSPITSMMGWVGILDKLLPKPREEKIEKAIDFIQTNTKKADALIADLLEVARVNDSSLQQEIVNLNKVVAQVEAVFKDSVQSTGAIITSENLPLVKGCLSHFESLFGNLINNALTYRDTNRSPRIEIRCVPSGQFYEFTIKDNGIGIKPQYQNRIFEMFKRLHHEGQYSGTGIGLAYCKKVVELHGGRIWVDSKPGLGSTFHFTYPIHSEEKRGSYETTLDDHR